MTDPRPRDLIGYGRTRPHAAWPGNARVAVSFVLNYEEGGERSVADGDPHAENYLTPEMVGLPPKPGRSFSVEDHFEYGSRAGFWRILRLFGERGLPFTCWAVGLALARNPDAGRAMAEAGHEVASHSWRWIDYAGMRKRRSGRTSAARCKPSGRSPAARRSAGTPAAIARTPAGW